MIFTRLPPTTVLAVPAAKFKSYPLENARFVLDEGRRGRVRRSRICPAREDPGARVLQGLEDTPAFPRAVIPHASEKGFPKCRCASSSAARSFSRHRAQPSPHIHTREHTHTPTSSRVSCCFPSKSSATGHDYDPQLFLTARPRLTLDSARPV